MKKNLGLIAVKLVERNSFFVGGWWVLGGFASSRGAHHVVIYVSPLVNRDQNQLFINPNTKLNRATSTSSREKLFLPNFPLT